MRVAIVEPHYDDAWLNVGGTILLRPRDEFVIVSVTRGRRMNPVPTTARLEQILTNVVTRDLALDDPGWDASRASDQSALAALARANGLVPADIASRVAAAIGTCDRVWLPLGMGHPTHEAVAELVLPWPTARYVEYPYAYVEAATLERRVRGRVRRDVDIRAALPRKLSIFEDVYASQRYVLSLFAGQPPLAALEFETLLADDVCALSEIAG